MSEMLRHYVMSHIVPRIGSIHGLRNIRRKTSEHTEISLCCNIINVYSNCGPL